ncbi:DUF378 domain-containing protein [Siminovitchia sediminis]|uniref:DUF378 domain-containing protein n=1 Tax=Siminovitchia sediminis TaxID=1274353 RepID=A0ABW4KG29_9BACI
MNTLRRIALALTIIGAINWGLIGLFNFNLVAALFGEGGLARLIYSLVGLSGLICLSYFFEQKTAENNNQFTSPVQDETELRPNYATEFAEEPDLDLAYNPSREEYDKEKE